MLDIILQARICDLRVCRPSSQVHLVFRVSTEKSGVILKVLSLYLTWPFQLVAFNIFSLLCPFSVFDVYVLWAASLLVLLGILHACHYLIEIYFFSSGKFSFMGIYAYMYIIYKYNALTWVSSLYLLFVDFVFSYYPRGYYSILEVLYLEFFVVV